MYHLRHSGIPNDDSVRLNENNLETCLQMNRCIVKKGP